MTNIDALRERIDNHKLHMQRYPNDVNAQRELDSLEGRLATEERHAAEWERNLRAEQAQRNAQRAAAKKRDEALAADRAEKARAVDAERAEKLEADLRRRYEMAAPGQVMDSDWNKVRAQILHDYRMGTLGSFGAGDEHARSAMRRSIRGRF